MFEEHIIAHNQPVADNGIPAGLTPDQWDAGCTVEMHGSIRQLLCPVCGLVIPMNDFLSQQLRRRTKIPCTTCNCPALRSRIMMYGDAEGDSPVHALSSGWHHEMSKYYQTTSNMPVEVRGKLEVDGC